MTQTNLYTLITGASQGIGKALAMECASRGIHVLLIALDEPILSAAAQEIKEKYRVKVDYLGVDLTREDSPQKIATWCMEKNYPIQTLINNAGFGKGGLFAEVDLIAYNRMIDLNNKAMVGLIYHLLPLLKQHPKAYILNMSSMEATLPLPYKTVYTGTKNFVYAISLALREELKTSNISVSVLCPGPVVTNEEGLERIKSHGARAKLIVMMPDEVAKIAITQMLDKKRVIIPGWGPYLIIKVMGLFSTGLRMSILERLFRVYK